jgi:hypothetical protein
MGWEEGNGEGTYGLDEVGLGLDFTRPWAIVNVRARG